jgi:hypothetical protein
MKPTLAKNLAVVLSVTIGMYLTIVFAIALLVKTDMVSRLENGIYASQVRSVIEDGDLNIVNQAPPEQRWMVSKTYNTPDFRENGSTALWLPFFVYGHLLPELNLGSRFRGSAVNHFDVALALATLFYALAAAIFSLWIMGFYLGERRAWISLALLTLGTPMLWYVFFEPYGTDLSSNFVLSGSIFLYLILLESKTQNASWWALLGATLAFGSSVKVYGAFYMIAIGLQVVLRWWMEGKKKEHARAAVFLSSSMVLVLLLHFSNHYLKFGTLTSQYWELQKYFAMFSSILSSPFHIYFGPSGWIFTSPIYLLAFVGMGYWVSEMFSSKTPLKNTLLSVRSLLVIVPVGILLLTSFEMIDENYGTARRLAAQQVAFLLGLQFLLTKTESRKFRWVLPSAIVAAAWGLFMTVRYASSKDIWGDSYWMSSALRIDIYRPMKGAIFAFPSVMMGLISWLPAVLISAGIIVFVWRQKSIRAAIPVLGIPVFLFVVISLLNFFLNASNVRKLQSEGFFASTVVANGMTAFIYDDLVSVIPKFKRLGQIRNDRSMLEDAETVSKTLCREIAGHILVDPIGFNEDCARGILRPSYFDVARP